MNDDFLSIPKKELTDNYKDEEDEDEDEEDGNMEGLNEDHRLHMTSFSTDYSITGYQNSSMKNDLKKNSGGKRPKPDDEEEDVKIESYIQRDVKSISVKDMRKLVPKLRIECFYTEQELSGKKKMKHLWDQKPPTWPDNIPFKDPNNPGKEGTTKKPGKNDLMKMYTYLREVYLKNKGLPTGSAVHTSLSQVSQQQPQQQQQQYHLFQQESSQAYYPHSYQPHQQLVQQHNLTPHMVTQQFHQQMAYSPTNELSGMHKITQQESMDEGQLIPSQVDPLVTNRMSNTSSNSPPINITNGSINQDVVKEEPFIIPNVVKELYNRIGTKVEKVKRLPGVTEAVKEQLVQVIEEVLNQIYLFLTNTSFCLMYLDAGHQMEALLDCMIVLGKVEVNLLSSGCSEIKKKFQNFDVWHVSSYIPRTLSYPETSDDFISGGISDCIKFRNKDHQKASSHINQRPFDLNFFLEFDDKDKKHEFFPSIEAAEVVGFNKIEFRIHNDPSLNLDTKEWPGNEFALEDIGDLLLSLSEDLDQDAPQNDVNPISTQLHQVFSYQTNSVPTCSNLNSLLINSTNPLLNAGDDFHIGGPECYQQAGIPDYNGGVGNGSFQHVQSSPFYDNNSSVRSDQSSIFSISSESGYEYSSHHAAVIPKCVEDMDCSDDYSSNSAKASRPGKRKKK